MRPDLLILFITAALAAPLAFPPTAHDLKHPGEHNHGGFWHNLFHENSDGTEHDDDAENFRVAHFTKRTNLRAVEDDAALAVAEQARKRWCWLWDHDADCEKWADWPPPEEIHEDAPNSKSDDNDNDSDNNERDPKNGGDGDAMTFTIPLLGTFGASDHEKREGALPAPAPAPARSIPAALSPQQQRQKKRMENACWVWEDPKTDCTYEPNGPDGVPCVWINKWVFPGEKMCKPVIEGPININLDPTVRGPVIEEEYTPDPEEYVPHDRFER